MPLACLISLPLLTAFSAAAPEAEERTVFVFLSCSLLWWSFFARTCSMLVLLAQVLEIWGAQRKLSVKTAGKGTLQESSHSL